MFFNQKSFTKKFLSLILTISLTLHPFSGSLVLAQEVAVSEAPAPTASEPTVTPQPEVIPEPSLVPEASPTPTPTPVAQADPAPLPSPTPSDSVSSPSPDPSTLPSESPFLTPTPVSDEPVSDSTPSATPVVEPVPVAEPTVTNEIISQAQTGNNLAENLGTVEIDTGQALALANLLNLLNTNIVGSNFQTVFIDSLAADKQIDLNQLWNQLQLEGGSDLLLGGDLTVGNLSFLNNNVSVSAGSGDNQITGSGDNSIISGDAAAVANVANLVNTNIIGSQFLLGVINLLGDQTGDVILPNPSKFFQNTSSAAATVLPNQSSAVIDNNVISSASTGENLQLNNNSNLMLTGDANSGSNIFSLANLDLSNNNWFFLLINNLGNWNGRIYGWGAPEAILNPVSGSQVLQNQTASNPQTLMENSAEENSLLQDQNSAVIINQVQALARTGGNQAVGNFGDSVIKTGNAASLANLVNLVNLNIIGGRWFFGLLNVLGNWGGNAVFAYPKLVVSLSEDKDKVAPGETVNYTINVTNAGYDAAENGSLNLSLPEGINSGDQTSWDLGKLEPGENKTFIIRATIDPDLKPEDKQTELIVNAFVQTSDLQSDNSQNSATVKTVVYIPEDNSDNVNQDQPDLEISGGNNIGEFVYPGDTLTYEIKVKNTGSGPSLGTVLTQQLFNAEGAAVGESIIELGKIEPGKKVKASFGLVLKNQEIIMPGNYYTVTAVKGMAQNGQVVLSNSLQNDFLVKGASSILLAGVSFAQSVPAEEGKVLGAFSPYVNPPEEEILPYFLLFLLSSWYVLSRVRAAYRKSY